MAGLFKSILKEGEDFDWKSSRGKQFEAKEKAIRDSMERTAKSKGVEDKRLIDKLHIQSINIMKKLEKRYNRTFSNIRI